MTSTSLPEGWVLGSLKDMAHWASGGTPSRAIADYYRGQIPWFKTGELGPRTVRESEERITEDALANSSAKLFPSGAVALAMYGATIGKVSILGVDASTNQACAVGIPTATSSSFLYYFLLSQAQAFIDAGKGGAQPNISQGIVKDWPVRIPPLAEQTRIVAKLEELLSDLDAGVAELRAAQAKLAQYRQSLLKAAVEGALSADWRARHAPSETGAQLLARILAERRSRWEFRQLARFQSQGKAPPKDWQSRYPEPPLPDTTTLPNLPEHWCWLRVDLAGEVQLGRQRAPQYHNGPNMVPYLRVANVFEDRIDISDVMEMHFSPEDEATFKLEHKDILLNEGQSLELVGRPAMFRDELPQACFTNTLVRFRTDAAVLPEFALTVFRHYMHSGRFRKIAKITTNIAHLGAGRFAELEFPLPGINEQREIVRILGEQFEQITNQERSVRVALKQSAAQRQNLLKAAFSGQLVPQDPADEPASALLERIRAERVGQTTVRKPRERKAREVA